MTAAPSRVAVWTLFLVRPDRHSPAGLHVAVAGANSPEQHTLRECAAGFRRTYGWGGKHWSPFQGGWRTEPDRHGRWWEYHEVSPFMPNHPMRMQLRGGLYLWPDEEHRAVAAA